MVVSLQRAVVLFFCAATLAAAQPTPERARHLVDLLLAGKYTELVAEFTPKMKAALSEETLATKVAPALKAFGAVKAVEAPQTGSSGDNTLYIFPVQLANLPINVNITLDKAGKVEGLFMQPRGGFPGATAPVPRAPYSKPDSFTEREVSFGAEGWKLPGTLSMPKGAGPFPAIVLVHGSGPHDRDQTIGPNKIFRDIAEGLASKGVAVLRYDKRTKVHGGKLREAKTITVREETVDDAVAAAAFLASQPEVNPKRVFLLGHSLGGYLAPRIAKQSGKLAGYISMAGNTRPLEDLVIEQNEYLLPLQIPDAAKAKEQLEVVRKQVADLKKAKPGATDGPTLLSVPAHYWVDLRGYDPAAAARALDLPALILQGERDYQVTMTDFAGWKKAFDGRPLATFKSYPALNHLFMTGTGKSRPEEYMRAGHVDPQVIEDLAAWITGR